MKKIFVIFLTIITISSATFLGGCSMLNSRSENEEMIQIAQSKKMKRALEDFLKELDPKALTPEGKIKSYEIQKDKLDYNPMGGLNVYIIINGEEKLYINAAEYNDNQNVAAALVEYRELEFGKNYLIASINSK